MGDGGVVFRLSLLRNAKLMIELNYELQLSTMLKQRKREREKKILSTLTLTCLVNLRACCQCSSPFPLANMLPPRLQEPISLSFSSKDLLWKCQSENKVS